MAPLDIRLSEHLPSDAQAVRDRLWDEYDRDYGQPWEQLPFALTAVEGDHIAGIASGWTGVGMAYLTELIVDPTRRGSGVGSQLMAAFETLALERGAPRLALRTAQGRPAQYFYERHGWHVEATLSDWYCGETYLHMRKDLSAG